MPCRPLIAVSVAVLGLLADATSARACWLKCKSGKVAPSDVYATAYPVTAPYYKLFCCINNQWTFRGSFGSVSAAETWARMYCAGCSYKVVLLGDTEPTGTCMNPYVVPPPPGTLPK